MSCVFVLNKIKNSTRRNAMSEKEIVQTTLSFTSDFYYTERFSLCQQNLSVNSVY